MSNSTRFRLSSSQADELYSAYLQCKHVSTRTRYQAVWLYGTGYDYKATVQITGVGRSSLMFWCQQYRIFGISSLKDKRKGGNSRKLKASQIEEIKELLHSYSPNRLFGDIKTSYWDTKTLRRLVLERYEVVYKDITSYHRLLKRCGFSYQRPGKVYKSRSEEQVLDFEQDLEKKIT